MSILYIANIAEIEITANSKSSYLIQLFDYAEKGGNRVISLCGNLEAEIAVLSDADKLLFMEEYNMNESGLDRLVHAVYNLLDLETFFAHNDKETRA